MAGVFNVHHIWLIDMLEYRGQGDVFVDAGGLLLACTCVRAEQSKNHEYMQCMQHE